MKKQVAILTCIIGLGVATQQGCGGAAHENPGFDYASLSGGDPGGLAAFVNGFYAFTKTQNCVKCHGATTTPKFADPDISVAYGYFKTLVNANDPANSIIVTYAGNGHCSDTPCSDPSVRPQVTSLLQNWAAAENAGGSGDPGGGPTGPAYMTGSLALPAGIPALGAAPKVLRFPLSGFNIPALSKAILEVELNMFNASEYRVARAKIMGNSSPVTVHGLHVFMRPSTASGIGLEDPNQGMGWVNIVATANTSTLPNNLPTGPLTATPLVTTAIGIAVQSASDVMTIGIDSFDNGTSTTIPSSVRFSDLISSNQQLGIFSQSCVSCHSAANPQAGLNLTNYAAAKAEAATIQSRMKNAGAPMPPTGLLSTTSRQVVDTWVNGGALQ
jgi:mono/diheme cytochrome c family protein